MLQLKAADQRTAAAVKSQFPTLRLSSSLFFQAPNLDELFEDIFWEALAAASQPLFDGGRRHADVLQSEATARGALYEYGSAVLTALREVQDALVLESQQEKLLVSLRAQRNSARNVYRLARKRYARGATAYLRVLNALQSLQSTQQQLLNGRRQHLSYRVQLCRALGGTWVESVQPSIEATSEE